MNCKCVSQRLDSYLDGELGKAEMLAVRTHLHDCAACAEEAEVYRSLKSALASMPVCEVPAGLEERLLSSVRREAKPTLSRRQVGLIWTSGLAAAATAGFLFVWLSLVGANESNARLASESAERASFELSRDQAYQNASDPLSGHSILVTASYGNR